MFFSKGTCTDFKITLDCLTWYASEEVASIYADVITVGINTSSWEAKGFNFKWDQGFRLGLNGFYNKSCCDNSFFWTCFRTENQKTIPFGDNARISPEFFAAFLSGNIPKSMTTNWSLTFNVLDWELGKVFCPCRTVLIRPFIGLKAGIINQTIELQYNDLIIDDIPTDFLGKEQLKNNFWGAGPSLGVNAKWYTNLFYLFSDLSIASTFGSWSCSDFYSNTVFEESSVTAKDSSLGTLMFRGFWGLGSEICLKDSYLQLKAGYEGQIWMNQLRIATFQLQRLRNDLTLQGLTLSAELNF